MSVRELDVYFAATDHLCRRVAKSDVYSITKQNPSPSPRLKPQRINFQASVFRESLTSDDAVSSSEPERDGIAKALVSDIFAITTTTVRVVCADDPDDKTSLDNAHALIAVVATSTESVDPLHVDQARTLVAKAFFIHKPPSR